MEPILVLSRRIIFQKGNSPSHSGSLNCTVGG